MALDGLVTGSADYRASATQRAKEIMDRKNRARDRARNRAYTRLANLHPHEWTELYAAACAEEEDLTPDTKV